MCVCFRCHDISKHVLPHPEHREQKRTGSKPSSPPHFVVRRGLWILSCRFSSGSVQNEISVAMFFVVPSVTLLSLKYIYIWKKKQNSHSSKSCSVSRVSRWIFHINLRICRVNSNVAGWIMLNHSIRLSNHQAVVDEKALFCCMFGHHVTGPKTIPPLALGATHLHLPRSAKICQASEQVQQAHHEKSLWWACPEWLLRRATTDISYNPWTHICIYIYTIILYIWWYHIVILYIYIYKL